MPFLTREKHLEVESGPEDPDGELIAGTLHGIWDKDTVGRGS